MFVRTLALSAALALATPAVAAAQTAPRFCRNFAFPDQGRETSGFPAFRMNITIPPSAANGSATIYPVIIPYPAGALNFSLVEWMHWYNDVDIPQGRVHLWGFIDRRSSQFPGAGANAMASQVFVNDRIYRYSSAFPDRTSSKATTIALSSPIHPGEAYSVGMVNFTQAPVDVMLAITVSACFPSQSELDNYTLYAEPSSAQSIR